MQPLIADRIRAFPITYVAIFAFLLLYVVTVNAVEYLLDLHFQQVVADAVQITSYDTPVAAQIQDRLQYDVEQSHWVRWGGIQVSVIAMGRDGLTFLYVGGRGVPPQPTLDLTANMREALELLPVSADVVVSVPHNALFSNGVLVAYAAVLLQVLYFYNRAVARAEAQRLTQALESRDLTARRAQTIQQELEAVRSRMHSIGTPPPEQGEEIRALVSEREALEGKLEALSQREEELRGSAARAAQLDQERLALEELLDEASRELGTKDDEIRKLEERLKGVARAAPPTSSKRARDQENLGRRLRTLYKNLEIDDRAIDDLVRLRDETMKLKAEESLKRLADDDDNALVRRKVGGLPPQLSIFELGFGGKGRIYYAKGKQRRFRVLTVGAKNSQKTDLEYLSRLSREDLG